LAAVPLWETSQTIRQAMPGFRPQLPASVPGPAEKLKAVS
jgi:hypothetical protein